MNQHFIAFFFVTVRATLEITFLTFLELCETALGRRKMVGTIEFSIVPIVPTFNFGILISGVMTPFFFRNIRNNQSFLISFLSFLSFLLSSFDGQNGGFSSMSPPIISASRISVAVDVSAVEGSVVPEQFCCGSVEVSGEVSGEISTGCSSRQ